MLVSAELAEEFLLLGKVVCYQNMATTDLLLEVLKKGITAEMGRF